MKTINPRRATIAITIAMVVVAVAFVTTHIAGAQPDPTRAITVNVGSDPTPLVSPAPGYAFVNVSTTSGTDYRIETTVTDSAGALVAESKIGAADPLTAADHQRVGFNITGYSSGSQFAITSIFKDAAGTVLDTQTTNWTKP